MLEKPYQSLYHHKLEEINSRSLSTEKEKIDKLDSLTKFITTRFGNILGSTGSAISSFTQQINHGGSVTVTHPDICRYFMTIPEACQLVLEGAVWAKMVRFLCSIWVNL